MKISTLKTLLDKQYQTYNTLEFITHDPIQIPHRFEKKEDIEIAGFFAASLAWGNRRTIISKCNELLNRMDDAPHAFVTQANEREWKHLKGFKHRTFTDVDLDFFARALRHLYVREKGLEGAFSYQPGEQTVQPMLLRFRKAFMAVPHEKRSLKHIANPQKGSAAKRLNMYLRWMVRQDNSGVDFGIWKHIPPAVLSCPLDVHSGRMAREFGLLERKQNDWKAVLELDENLRKLDPKDPAKYDFALFGMGVEENP